MDGQTDGVTALLDLLSPSATQVKNPMEETPTYNLQVQFTLSLKSTFLYQLYYIYNYVLKVGWQRDHNLNKINNLHWILYVLKRR